MENVLYTGEIGSGKIEIILLHNPETDTVELWQNGCVVSKARLGYQGPQDQLLAS